MPFALEPCVRDRLPVWIIGMVCAAWSQTGGILGANRIVVDDFFVVVVGDRWDRDTHFYIHAALVRILANDNRVGRRDLAAISGAARDLDGAGCDEGGRAIAWRGRRGGNFRTPARDFAAVAAEIEQEHGVEIAIGERTG